MMRRAGMNVAQDALQQPDLEIDHALSSRFKDFLGGGGITYELGGPRSRELRHPN
jgi:hypothetical protein